MGEDLLYNAAVFDTSCLENDLVFLSNLKLLDIHQHWCFWCVSKSCWPKEHNEHKILLISWLIFFTSDHAVLLLVQSGHLEESNNSTLCLMVYLDCCYTNYTYNPHALNFLSHFLLDNVLINCVQGLKMHWSLLDSSVINHGVIFWKCGIKIHLQNVIHEGHMLKGLDDLHHLRKLWEN